MRHAGGLASTPARPEHRCAVSGAASVESRRL